MGCATSLKLPSGNFREGMHNIKPFSPLSTIFIFRTAKHLSKVMVTKAFNRFSSKSVIRISVISMACPPHASLPFSEIHHETERTSHALQPRARSFSTISLPCCRDDTTPKTDDPEPDIKTPKQPKDKSSLLRSSNFEYLGRTTSSKRLNRCLAQTLQGAFSNRKRLILRID